MDEGAEQVVAGHTTEEISLADRNTAFRMIKSLEVSIQALTQAFNGIRSFSRRTRAIATGTIIALVIAILGGGGAIVAYVRADNADSRSLLNSRYLLENCRAANESRADQRKLWATIIAISDKPKTKAEVVRLETFKTTVNTIFAERDCSKVAEGKVK